MKHVTLIVGAAPAAGADHFYRALLASAEKVVACDAAGEWCCALGRIPDIAVGDFDSATLGAAERLRGVGVDVRVYPREKDETDLDLALRAARETGCQKVVFTAAFTLRLDHTLAAVGTLLRASDMEVSVQEPGFFGVLADAAACPSVSFSTAPGQTVSVIALRAASGVSLTGLAYPLDNADLDLLSSLGVSNTASGGHVSVTLAEGTVLVLASRDEAGTSHD